MNLICINCPKGCHLTVEEVNGEVKVEGNSCPRGVVYATNELKNPLRTLTSTVPIDSDTCARLPIISDNPVPKGKLMDIMKDLKDVKAKAPVHMGDIVLENIEGLGINMIASKTILK